MRERMLDYTALSQRQRNILSFIETFYMENGYPPTIREIGKSVGIASTSVVDYNLNKLVRDGWLERSRSISRGLQLVQQKLSGQQLTISLPIHRYFLSEDLRTKRRWEFNGSIDVPSSLIGKATLDQLYAYRVSGYDLLDAMVGDGDLIVIQKGQAAGNGEAVVMTMTGTQKVVIKRIYVMGQMVRLESLNPLVETEYAMKDQIQVQGKVLSVMRTL